MTRNCTDCSHRSNNLQNCVEMIICDNAKELSQYFQSFSMFLT